jgi:hypothetical protein
MAFLFERLFTDALLEQVSVVGVLLNFFRPFDLKLVAFP